MKKVSLVAQAQHISVALLCGFLFVACGGDDTGTKTKPGQEEDRDMSAMEQKDISVEEDIVKEPEPEEQGEVNDDDDKRGHV